MIATVKQRVYGLLEFSHYRRLSINLADSFQLDTQLLCIMRQK